MRFAWGASCSRFVTLFPSIPGRASVSTPSVADVASAALNRPCASISPACSPASGPGCVAPSWPPTSSPLRRRPLSVPCSNRHFWEIDMKSETGRDTVGYASLSGQLRNNSRSASSDRRKDRPVIAAHHGIIPLSAAEADAGGADSHRLGNVCGHALPRVRPSVGTPTAIRRREADFCNGHAVGTGASLGSSVTGGDRYPNGQARCRPPAEPGRPTFPFASFFFWTLSGHSPPGSPGCGRSRGVRRGAGRHVGQFAPTPATAPNRSRTPAPDARRTCRRPAA
jgi:hypothetical protein